MYRFVLESEGIAGNLTLASNEAPVGWEDMEIELVRHPKFHGIFPNVSTKLQFYCSGYTFLLNAYENLGINAEVFLRIDYACDNTTFQEVFYGQLDFSDIEFTERYASLTIKSSNCIDKFLDRSDISVNLYDEPCFDELTFDKIAQRIRYVFKPYLVNYPEKSILGIVQWRLQEDNYEVTNKFSLDGGLGCSLLISVDPDDPNNVNYCGNVDPDENADGKQSWYVDPNTGYFRYPLINGFPAEVLIDDLNFLNPGYAPQTNAEQFHRDCGNNEVMPEEIFDEEFEYNGELTNCSCCGNTAPAVSCGDYLFEIDVAADMKICLDVVEGVVEWFNYQHQLVFQFGNYEIVLQDQGIVTDTNGCAGWDDTEQCDTSVNICTGSQGCLIYNGLVTVPACLVPANAKFRIITRTFVGFKAGGAVAGNSNLSIVNTTTWLKNEGIMLTEECIPNAKRVGETKAYSYMVHEAFSSLVEYYTNNCLKVKSDFFGRPNSMLGADDPNYQCPPDCDIVSYGSDEIFCCESTYVYDRNYFLTQCSSTHIPPAIPPLPCTDFILDQPITIGAFARNACNLEMMDGCVEVTVPGVYEISLTLNIDNSTAHVAYFNSNNSFSGAYLQTVFYLKIGLDVYVPYSYTAVSTGSGCQTGSNLPTNIFAPLTVQKTFTQNDIDLGNNRICLTIDMLATSDVISCSESEATMSAFNELTITNGILNIEKIDCELPPVVTECIPCPTFDPVPYQSCEAGGCGAWTVITNGLNLRQFGTAFYVSFNELFEAMDAVWNIGAGWLENDKNNIRIENKSYFYQRDNIILTIESLDKHESKWKRTSLIEKYANQIKTGYAKWLQDVVNTIDAFHTNREYGLPISNVKKSLDIQSSFIADGYAIEYQRRQRWSANADMDDEKFIICVGRNQDPSNVNCYGDPDHMYRVEIGVDMPFSSQVPAVFYAPDGFIDPNTIYNFRISPLANTTRHLNVIKSSLFKAPLQQINFTKGEANFTCGGMEVCAKAGCDVGYDYENDIEQVWAENEDIDPAKFNNPANRQIWINETIEFEYAISISEYMQIRQNPYGVVKVEGQLYFLLKLNFKNNKPSRFTLLRAY